MVSRHDAAWRSDPDTISRRRCEIDRALDIKAEMPISELLAWNSDTPRFLPKPAEQQIGADTASSQFCQFAPVEPLQHDRPPRMSGGRRDQTIE
jgi:hypothetical protein